MGKKGSWFSAIKRVFTPHSREKLADESERKTVRDKKKKGFGRLRHGETNSFLPIFREPSSIEKILGEAEREHRLTFRPPPTPPLPEQSKIPNLTPRNASPRVLSQRISSPPVPSPRATSPKSASPRPVSPRAASPRPLSPKAASSRAASSRIFSLGREIRYRPEPTLRNQHTSATKIQTFYRGYMARRSFRALKGLVRLQGVVRGQNVKRQTANAMKYMQLLVRVQTQIQSRRIQMLENQTRHQSQYKNDSEVDRESNLGKWTRGNASEAGNEEDWDDSVLAKEEKDARLQRKVEAVVKRERAMAYAYSNQLWKGSPTTRSNQPGQSDIRSSGSPWWWNWLERQLPSTNSPTNQPIPFTPQRPHSELIPSRNYQLTPQHHNSEQRPSPRPQTSTPRQQSRFGSGFDSPKSTILTPGRNIRTPPSSSRPQAKNSSWSKYSNGRAGVGSPLDLKDDDSLTSCPAFSVPNYMSPTVSTKAKVRANSNPKERAMSTPGSEKRRLSFPFMQGVGSFKWNKGKEDSTSSPVMMINKRHSPKSVSNLSIDSTVSMPAALGRKPFNRFV